MLTGIITWLLRGWLSRWALSAEGEIKAGWKWLTSSAVHFLSAALVLSLIGNWVLLERGNRYRDKLERVHAVQHEAGKAQAAVNHEPARVSGDIARKSNAEAPAYYDRVRRAADAHAIRMRRPADPVGGTDLPRADPPEPGIHGPALDAAAPQADLVCRPAADDAWLVYAAGRAAKMQAEAQDLIAAGVAVADDSIEPQPADQPTDAPAGAVPPSTK